VSPFNHVVLSWLAAQGLPERRDRGLVVLAGVAPDLDGLSLLGGLASYGRWHHVVAHNVLAAALVAVACSLGAHRRRSTFVLALGAFHLHLLCDLAGSGPDWPIMYLWPWSRVEWGWSGGWELNGWQNQVIALLAALACLGTALTLGRTFVEVFSARLDGLVVATIRRRFARATGTKSPEDRSRDRD
jgi:hypothetical protein